MDFIKKVISVFKEVTEKQWRMLGDFFLYSSIFLETHKIFMNNYEQNGFIFLIGIIIKICTKLAEMKSKK